MMQAGFTFSTLAHRLAALSQLTSDDFSLLAHMPKTIRHFDSREVVLRQGHEKHECCLLLQGHLCWRWGKIDGQITSIYVPGDIPDLLTLYDLGADSHLIALGRAVVTFVPHSFLCDISSRSVSLSRAFLRMLVSEQAIHRNWIVNLGSRDALTRVAHLFCEIILRLQNVGLAREPKVLLSFTQSDLAAACSISPVHANRTIQELRRRNLLYWSGKTLTVIDWPGLTKLGRFDPSYLKRNILFGDETSASHSSRRSNEIAA